MIDGFFPEQDPVFIKTMIFQLFRDEVAPGYFNLLFGNISADFNQFQTVAQRWRDCIQGICSCDEQDFRQIIFDFQVIVVELKVLFGVQYLQ